MASGGTLTLEKNSEYSSQLVLDKNAEIIGNGATVWSPSGTVIQIKSGAKVKIVDLNIELVTPVSCTFTSNPESQQLALLVEAGADVTLQNVKIKGGVSYKKHEDWEYPAILYFGHLKPGVRHSFTMEIALQKDTRLISTSPVISIEEQSSVYENFRKFKLELSSPMTNEVLWSTLNIVHNFGVKQVIYLHGQVASSGDDGEIANLKTLFTPMFVKGTKKETKPNVPKMISAPERATTDKKESKHTIFKSQTMTIPKQTKPTLVRVQSNAKENDNRSPNHQSISVPKQVKPTIVKANPSSDVTYSRAIPSTMTRPLSAKQVTPVPIDEQNAASRPREAEAKTGPLSSAPMMIRPQIKKTGKQDSEQEAKTGKETSILGGFFNKK